MNGYRRLTPKDRYQIEFLKARGASNAAVARALRVNRSSIGRELALCSGKYSAERAGLASVKRQANRSAANRKIKAKLKELVDDLLLEDWSPEQIEVHLKSKKRAQLSYKTIYRYIERDKLRGGRLKNHLRILRKQRKDRKKPKYKSYQGLVKDRVGIEKRPKVVDRRNRIGDYERDTVCGAVNGNVLLTIVDRKTRYVHLACLPKNNARLVHEATVRLLKNRAVKTITNDNGVEFAFHQKTSKALGTKIYFSRSYAAWQRGTNENMNGLLRQYFPKRKPIEMLNRFALQRIQRKLNHRPRKCLGFKPPHQLYNHKTGGRVLR